MSIQEMQDEFEAFCAMEGDRVADKAQLMRCFMWAWKRSRARFVVFQAEQKAEAAKWKVKP